MTERKPIPTLPVFFKELNPGKPGISFFRVLLFAITGWMFFLPIPTLAIQDGRDNRYSIRVVDSLNELARRYWTLDADRVGLFANEALQRAQVIRYKHGQRDAFANLGIYYFSKSDYYNSLRCRFSEIDLIRQSGKSDSLLYAYLDLVSFFLEIKDAARSAKYLDVAGQLAGASASPANMSRYYMEKGKLNYFLHEYNKAISDLYYALYFVKKAGGTPELEMHIFKFLGDAFLQQEVYAKAIFHYENSMRLCDSIRNQAETGVLLTRLAHAYSFINNDAAVMHFNFRAFAIRKELGQQTLVASSYLNIGNTYQITGHQDSALHYFMKGYELSLELNHIYLLEVFNKQLYEYFLEQKQYQKAFGYLVLYKDYHEKRLLELNKSEIGILESRHLIREAEIKHELLKEEYEYQTLQMSNRTMQIILFEALFVTLLALSLLVYSLYKHNRDRKKGLQELNNRLQEEITRRNEAEAELSQREEMYRFLADNSVDMISIIHPELGRTFVSPSCKALYGYTVEEMMQIRDPYDLILPSSHEQVRREYDQIIANKTPKTFIFKALRKDGTTFWAESMVNPFYDNQTGKMTELITVIRDITDRISHQVVMAENARQKEILLREIHNRVKNNFSVLISLMNMQREINPMLNQSLTDLTLRVRTMSLVHEQLYHTRGISIIPLGEYLQNLVLIISDAFHNDRIRVMTDIRSCELNIELALPLGLIVNELLTNSFKYAFPGNRKGTIEVSLIPEEGDRWALMIRDDGVGLKDGFASEASHSMGSQIVQILVEQIEAEFSVTGNGGTCFVVRFAALLETN